MNAKTLEDYRALARNLSKALEYLTAYWESDDPSALGHAQTHCYAHDVLRAAFTLNNAAATRSRNERSSQRKTPPPSPEATP